MYMKNNKPYHVPRRSFDGYDKDNGIKVALGSERTARKQEAADIRSVNWVPNVSGWRLTPQGLELGNPTDTLPPGSITSTTISDFDEASQDAVGNAVGNGLDYNDGTGAISVDETEFTTILSGVYTPTRSAEANLDANVTMTEAQYMRVGNTVTVSGRFTADATAAGLASFEITLPVASNLGAIEDLAGVASSVSATTFEGGEVIGVVANDTAKISWIAVDTASRTWSYTFTYQVI